MRKVLIIFSLLVLTAGFICAQEYGAIRGKVTDMEGNALPGVSVTLTGSKTAPRSIVSSAEGNFRFLNLSVANDYQVVFELNGFQVVTPLSWGTKRTSWLFHSWTQRPSPPRWEAVRAKEAGMQANQAAGRWVPEWVDRRLEELGCEILPKQG